MKDPTRDLNNEAAPSQQIDAIIENITDWRAGKLAHLRSVILKCDPSISEEVKWKKPSRPEGVPVWYLEGNICVADVLKNAVRLTFPKGASIEDGGKLFNTRLDSKTTRAVDYHENDPVEEGPLKKVVLGAIELNRLKAGSKKS